jgi:hypothetical protein
LNKKRKGGDIFTSCLWQLKFCCLKKEKTVEDSKRINIYKGIVVGALFCGLVAYSVAPKTWLLAIMAGALAGFAMGYIGYDVGGFLKSIPKAIAHTYQKLIPETDPFYEAVAACTIILLLCLFTDFLYEVITDYGAWSRVAGEGNIGQVAVIISMVTLIIIVYFMAFTVKVIKFFAKRGSRDCDWVFWYPIKESYAGYDEYEKKRLIRKGLRPVMDFTTGDVAMWALKGISVVLFSIISMTIIASVRFVPVVWNIIRTFFVEFFKLVYCQERVMAGFYALPGAIASFLYFHFFFKEMTVLETTAVIVFGAMISLAIGYLCIERFFEKVIQKKLTAECV